jgi:hypothetical protein
VNKIIKANRGRISVTDAKRLLVAASPREKFLDFYADADGNLYDELVEKPRAEAFITDEFIAFCADQTVRPRNIYRPSITDYRGPEDDQMFDIAHDEFERLAAIYGAEVIIGATDANRAKAGEPHADPSEALVKEQAYRLAKLRELGGDMEPTHNGGWRAAGGVSKKLREALITEGGRKRTDDKTIRQDLVEAAAREAEEKREGKGEPRPVPSKNRGPIANSVFNLGGAKGR